MRQSLILLTVFSTLSFGLISNGSNLAVAASAPKIKWQSNLKKAGQEAVRTGKPVLIFFTATWCGYCHKMLETTYHDELVVRQVNQFFVPVLLDADQNDRLVKLLKIESFPTTVLVSPQQEILTKFSGYFLAAPFTKKVAPWCKSIDKPNTQVALDDKSPNTQPNKKTANTQTLAAPAPVGFDGYCLVSMLNKREWVLGNERFTTEMRGRKLRFAAAADRDEFLRTPSKFWPLDGGVCPVAVVREEKQDTGNPRTAGVFKGQLVFFKSIEHRSKFAKDPLGYLPKIIAGNSTSDKIRR